MDKLEQSQRHYDVVVLLEETYPFRPKNMIDGIITKLINEGHDTVFAGEPEARGVWVKKLNKIRLLGMEENLSMPSALKESRNIISLLGLCCVTHSASLRNSIVFSGKVGIVEINDPLALISARNKEDLKLVSILDKNI